MVAALVVNGDNVSVTSGEGEGEDEMQEGMTRSMTWSNLSSASWVAGERWTEELPTTATFGGHPSAHSAAVWTRCGHQPVRKREEKEREVEEGGRGDHLHQN
jgi:hypothetical protein